MNYLTYILLGWCIYSFICVFLYRKAVKRITYYFQELLHLDRAYYHVPRMNRWKHAFAQLCKDSLDWEKDLRLNTWGQMLNPFFINCLDDLEKFERRLKQLSLTGTLINSQTDQGNQQSSSDP